MNRKILFISAAGLLLLAFVIAVVLFQNHQAGQQSAAMNSNLSLLNRDGAPTKGANEAKVTIVEFLDPACGTCRSFHPLVEQLLDQYPGQVRVMIRYAPLHPGSDQVVKMLEAAHHQGKFWPALELLFSNQPRWVINHTSQPMRARSLLNGLDLDQEKFSADWNSPEVSKTIQQDIQDGQRLNVRATPEFFVNGRPIPSFGYEQLSNLVKDAVDDNY